MSTIRLSGTSSGYYDLTVPAVAGTNSIDLSNLPVKDPNGMMPISGSVSSNNFGMKIENTNASGYSTLQMGGTDAGMYRNGSSQTSYGGASSLNLITVSGHPISLSTSNTVRMKIDGSGYVTTPSQPGFSVYTTASTVPNNTIQFGGTDFNTGTHFNTSTGVFTAPIAGKYWFFFHLLQTRTTSNGEGYVDIYKNGSYVYRNYEYKEATLNQHVEYKGGYIINLAVNDTIKLFLQASVGSLGIIANTQHCKFSGYLLG